LAERKFGYREMRQTILEKLGKPARITTHQYRTVLGASTTGEEMTWRWPSGTAAQLERALSRVVRPGQPHIVVFSGEHGGASGTNSTEATRAPRAA
jgi:hypothetical protein